MILQESPNVLESRQRFGGLYGTPTLLQRIQSQANASFGHNWALLLNPGDSPDFGTFLTDIGRMEQMGIPFVIDVYTSDVEYFTTDWAFAVDATSPPTFQPPFTPANNTYVIMLSPDQLSQVGHAAPTTFIGMRTHEEPVMTGSSALDSVMAWIVSQPRPLFVNPGPDVWFTTWLPFIQAHGRQVVPLVSNNWTGSLDPNWTTEETLYHQGVVPRIGWSVQNFFIAALTNHQVSETEAPYIPYVLFSLYDRAYGGSVFEYESMDNSVFTDDGYLTDQGREVAQFFQALAGSPPVPPGLTSRDTYGVLAFDQSGQVCQDSCGEWMGASNLSWSTPSFQPSGELDLSYTVSQMYSANGTALIAIWNPGPTAFPTSASVNGRLATIKPTFRDFAEGAPGAWYDGGNVLYVRTKGNSHVQVTYQAAQHCFAPALSPLPINQFGALIRPFEQVNPQ